ncbi:MAG: hypothetical protein ACM3S5_08455 [Rhodospirillales bacterium]
MISTNDLELSGILKSPSAVHLIVSSAKEIPAGARIAVPFIGEPRSAHVQECVPYQDRFLLWLELAECLGA